MGTYLSTPRLPLSWGVDLLTGRRDIVDLKRGQFKRMEDAYTFWLSALPERAPYSLNFSKFYKHSLDAITGRLHDHRFLQTFIDEEPEDPRFWAVYGARRIGWKPKHVFPFRYSLPEDIQAIVDELRFMTEVDLRRNVEHVLEVGEDRYASEVLQRWMREQAAAKLLPALLQFYRAALEDSEIVVYWLA